jgi:hypothetical protein
MQTRTCKTGTPIHIYILNPLFSLSWTFESCIFFILDVLFARRLLTRCFNSGCLGSGCLNLDGFWVYPYIAYSVVEIASQPLTIIHILEGICVLRPNNTHHIVLRVATSRLTNAAQVIVIANQAFETAPHQWLLTAITDHIRMDLTFTTVLPLAASFIIITVIICCVIVTVIITVVII